MLKKIKKKISFAFMIMMTSILFVGCSDSNKPENRLKEIKPVSVTVEGVELKVGQSKLGEILDGGLLISPDLKYETSVDGLQLEKMSLSLAYVNKDEYNLGTINFVNNTEESMNYKDCTINKYKMTFKKQWLGSKEYKYNNILVDGINFNGMTIDDVKNAMSRKTDDVSEIKQPDGSIENLTYIVNKVRIGISFDSTTKIVSEVEVEVSNSYFE